jgi:hypothetical protein
MGLEFRQQLFILAEEHEHAVERVWAAWRKESMPD